MKHLTVFIIGFVLGGLTAPPTVKKECYKQTIESSPMTHRIKCP